MGWRGPTAGRGDQQHTALGLCPSLCVLPHLRVDQAGAVPHQGMEAAKAESRERLQMGMFLLSQVSLGNASILGILGLLKEVIPGPGRAPVTFHLGAKMKN